MRDVLFTRFYAKEIYTIFGALMGTGPNDAPALGYKNRQADAALTASVVKDFERLGVASADGVLSFDAVCRARSDAESLLGAASRAGRTKGVRGNPPLLGGAPDATWTQTDGAKGCGAGLKAAVDVLRGVASALTQSKALDLNLDVPPKCDVVRFGETRTGAIEPGAIDGQGVIVALFLNPGWDEPTGGGTVRAEAVGEGADGYATDIAPLGGRLVIVREAVAHEVLPAASADESSVAVACLFAGRRGSQV